MFLRKRFDLPCLCDQWGQVLRFKPHVATLVTATTGSASSTSSQLGRVEKRATPARPLRRAVQAHLVISARAVLNNGRESIGDLRIRVQGPDLHTLPHRQVQAELPGLLLCQCLLQDLLRFPSICRFGRLNIRRWNDGLATPKRKIQVVHLHVGQVPQDLGNDSVERGGSPIEAEHLDFGPDRQILVDGVQGLENQFEDVLGLVLVAEAALALDAAIKILAMHASKPRASDHVLA
mmetsp:Transcript_177842/g.570377  ORF Transcript_177842/g.570377 Transcript_177842/m.570377 type:complete len:235 (+) Transcript_177842:3647-4351(+)